MRTIPGSSLHGALPAILQDFQYPFILNDDHTMTVGGYSTFQRISIFRHVSFHAGGQIMEIYSRHLLQALSRFHDM